jgi:hypothetical protein
MGKMDERTLARVDAQVYGVGLLAMLNGRWQRVAPNDFLIFRGGNAPEPGTLAGALDKFDFVVGDKVHTTDGYKWPGVVIAAFRTLKGKAHYVVECTAEPVEGFLWVFDGSQLEKRKDEIKAGDEASGTSEPAGSS